VERASSYLQEVATEDRVAGRYLPIPLESLCLKTVTSFKIYVLTHKEREPVLYRAGNLPLTEKVRSRLLDHDVERIYIDISDERNYRDYIEQNLDKIVADDSIESSKKAQIVYSSATYLARQLLESPWMRDGIRRSETLVKSTLDFVLRDEAAFSGFLAVRSHDYYTYTHCVNVCVFCVALARKVGVEEMSELLVLGTGALLHDIGKSSIDKSILNKKGPLTEEEWVIMKRHPVRGVEILREAGGVPDGSYAVVYQHHERCNGSGYPEGLPGEKIHRYGKLAGIVDVFDAMTTKRVYKDAVDSFTAFLTMKNEMCGGLDMDIFREFVKLMAR